MLNRQIVNATRLFSKTLLASILSLFALTPLSAENSGAFVEGGFEYSTLTGEDTENDTAYSSVSAQGLAFSRSAFSFQNPFDGALFGANVQIGYKQFFGQRKMFGLRYYGFFSGQGGLGSFEKAPTEYDNDVRPVAWSKSNQATANLFYGVGVDALFNFYEKEERTLGIFAGLMIGGSSWLMGAGNLKGECRWRTEDEDGNLGPCQTMEKYFSNQTKQANASDGGGKATFHPTFVQFIVNLGLRSNFTKHQGLEFGVRIPTINNSYYTVTNTLGGGEGYLIGGLGSKRTITLRRTVGVFVNYVYSF
ncbi:outer membrane protein [Helicobacter felis]|uniref:outer membrane protein n=1 Tax=Helicobacter felis TaxID=214 RepID=UPI000CF1A61E|nr:outer membrane protein [Helicobacter felis]